MSNNTRILDLLRNHKGAVFSRLMNGSGQSLKRKLFSYMFLLVCLLLLVLVTGMFLLGQFNSTAKDTFDALDMQMEVFEKDIVNHFDSIAAAGVNLAQNMTSFLEEYLREHSLSFSDLTDNSTELAALQSMLLEPLMQQLRQEDCSGVFVMLDTTVNSTVANSDTSRCGLYLKTNGYKSTYNPVSMLRGDAEIARAGGIIPHRQWRLEFDTEQIPEYEQILTDAQLPITEAYRFTRLLTLSGTEDTVMLLTVPMVGRDGTFYGISGFEISESYFMSYHAQPTKVNYLTYIMTPDTGEAINTADGFSCGASDGYYRAPQGSLSVHAHGNALYTFDGDGISYLGVRRTVSLSPNSPDYLLSVMMRKSDFDRDMRTENIKNVTLCILLLLAAVSCCYYFSRRFLTPILRSLEQLKSESTDSMDYDIPEIVDLFEFLAKKDRDHEEALHTLEQEKQHAMIEKDSLREEYEKVQTEYGKTQTEFEKAQAELARLAYSRQAEIDPDAYAQFLDGIGTLTHTERKIFNYYLDGLGIKEIADTMSVKESTVYSHNKNIYGKLGINSLKQLLRYAALMRQQEAENADQA